MSAPNNLTGKHFNQWTVIKRAGSNKKGNSLWECRCECGTIAIVVGYSLTGGTSKSCGCAQKESVSKMNTTLKRTHGKKNTRLYRIWRGMKARCFNKNSPDYDSYGGRGITVCKEWKHDFMNFYAWAIDNGYDDSLSIDRIENNGNYEPGNCRWATASEQNRNRRTYKWKKNR